MFWQQYRRTAPYVQLLIVVVVGLLFYRNVPWPQVLAVLLVMEVAALLGAAWAIRLKRKMSDPTLLPPRSTKY